MQAAQVRRFVISDHPLPWLLPLVAILLVFTVYPLFYNIWLSFHEYAPRRRALEYVGTRNWVQLWEDARFWQSLTITFVYFAVALAIELVLGMAIALLLDSDGFGFGFLRGLLTMTLVIPPAIAGMMYLLMEDPQFGVISYFLQWTGLLDPAHPILATASTALAGVLLPEIWQWTPFMVLIRDIDLFRVFDYVFVMTSGGPGTSTYTLSLYAWQQTFSFVKWGYGATLRLVTLVIILVVASLFIKVAKVRW